MCGNGDETLVFDNGEADTSVLISVGKCNKGKLVQTIHELFFDEVTRWGEIVLSLRFQEK